MTHRPTILGGIRWGIDALVVVILAAVLVAVVVARGLPALGHDSLVIRGGSMAPAIPVGSVIVLGSIGADGPMVGDVVSIRAPTTGTVYTHRVAEVLDRSDGRWLRTRGDANAAPDPALVPAGWAVGRVVLAIPALGYLIWLLSTISGLAFVVGLGLTLALWARLVEEIDLDRRSARRAAVARSLRDGGRTIQAGGA